MLIDTHAHINLKAFETDADEVLQRCFDAGVGVVNVGTDITTSKYAVELVEQYANSTSPNPSLERRGIWAAVGLHPSHTYDNPYLDENESGVVIGREIFDYEAYRKLAQHPRVVGIGECGLDYYRLYDTDIPMNTDDTDNTDKKYELIKQQQREAFLLQIKLAKELDKVLVIHCRPSEGSTDAYSDLFEIITNYQLPITNENQKPLRFEIHSFTGSWETAEKFLELGGFLGFNGIITFDKTGVAAEVVKKTPMNRILLETDSPYLAPVPFRGKRNTPLNVEYIAQKIAEIKGLEYDYYEVARQTSKNASVLFHLNLDWPLDSL